MAYRQKKKFTTPRPKKTLVLSGPTEPDFLIAAWEIVTPVSPRLLQARRFDYQEMNWQRNFHYCADVLLQSVRPKERDELYQTLQHYQIHHILPLSLGGTNDLRNLVLIERALHRELHEQMRTVFLSYTDLPHWAARAIPIPRHPRLERVWGLAPTRALIEIAA